MSFHTTRMETLNAKNWIWRKFSSPFQARNRSLIFVADYNLSCTKYKTIRAAGRIRKNKEIFKVAEIQRGIYIQFLPRSDHMVPCNCIYHRIIFFVFHNIFIYHHYQLRFRLVVIYSSLYNVHI